VVETRKLLKLLAVPITAAAVAAAVAVTPLEGLVADRVRIWRVR